MVDVAEIKGFRVEDISETKDWHAWINLMPPPPNELHVVGDVLVGNPGVEASLLPVVPQGFNPRILLLRLILVQKPGFWPQVQTWVQARYDKVVCGQPYHTVQVLSDGDLIADMTVEEVH